MGRVSSRTTRLCVKKNGGPEDLGRALYVTGWLRICNKNLENIPKIVINAPREGDQKNKKGVSCSLFDWLKKSQVKYLFT